MPKRSQRILLIGPMGAGKSTTGRRLARRLVRRFVDLDRAIEERTGVDIPTIFDIEGEAGFRRRESAMLGELIDAHPEVVIATGGGTVLDPANRERMRAAGLIVYLRASVATQFERVRDSRRPLLQGANAYERLIGLFEERDPIYRRMADLIVTTDGDRSGRVVNTIYRHLSESSGS